MMPLRSGKPDKEASRNRRVNSCFPDTDEEYFRPIVLPEVRCRRTDG